MNNYLYIVIFGDLRMQWTTIIQVECDEHARELGYRRLIRDDEKPLKDYVIRLDQIFLPW